MLPVERVDGELDGRLGLAHEHVDALVDGLVQGGLVVDLDDASRRLDAGGVCGGVFQRRDDLEVPALEVDLGYGCRRTAR